MNYDILVGIIGLSAALTIILPMCYFAYRYHKQDQMEEQGSDQA